MSRAYLRCEVTANCDGCERTITTSSAMVTFIAHASTPHYRFVCPACRCINTHKATPTVAAMLTAKEWRSWREFYPEEHDPARVLGPWIPGEADRTIRQIAEMEEVPGPAAPGQPWTLPNDFPTPRLCDAIAEAWPGDV